MIVPPAVVGGLGLIMMMLEHEVQPSLADRMPNAGLPGWPVPDNLRPSAESIDALRSRAGQARTLTPYRSSKENRHDCPSRWEISGARRAGDGHRRRWSDGPTRRAAARPSHYSQFGDMARSLAVAWTSSESRARAVPSSPNAARFLVSLFRGQRVRPRPRAHQLPAECRGDPRHTLSVLLGRSELDESSAAHPREASLRASARHRPQLSSAREWPRRPGHRRDAPSPSTTRGTTARPKGVQLTHRTSGSMPSPRLDLP